VPDGFEPDTQPMPAQQPATGWVLGGRYRVEQRVGSGGMAEVFRAHDELLDRDVAVKVFRSLLDDPDGSTNGEARRELELQALAQLNHPNLITLYDGYVGGDGPAYLVLEFVDGPDLSSRLADGPLPEPLVREVGAQLADALAYVHAHGLVHRDVKPANILLGGDGSGRVRARLSDFGIVRMIGRPQVTSVNLTIGTAYYLAPEQARGSAVGPPADVYALGLVLLEALTGERAFAGPMHEALAARLTGAPPIPDGLPAPWPALLAAMTATDPADRPDAATVARQLDGVGRATALTTALPAGTAVAAALAAPAALATGTTAAFGAGSATGATAALGSAAAGAATGATAALGTNTGPSNSGPSSAGPPPSPRHRRSRWASPPLLVAAVLLVALVATGAFLLSAKSADAPTDTGPTSPTRSASTSATHHRSTSAAADVGGPATQPVQPASERRRSSTAARPSTSAPTKAPTTSAPPSTSSAPPSTSSAAPPSSAPTTETSPPASTPTPGSTPALSTPGT
jgi:serine/threonine protein kinase